MLTDAPGIQGRIMANFSTARAVIGIVFCLAALSLNVFPADAAAKTKPRKYIFDDLVTPSMLEPLALPARAPATGGARFFSINSVMAKFDGKSAPNEPVRLASVATDTVISDAPSEFTSIAPSQPSTNEPFGLFTFRAPEGILWRKWRAVKNDIAAELRQVEACRADRSNCTGAARRFVLIADEVRGQSGTAKIETANRLINTAIRYMSDLAQHSIVDVWSTPLVSLGTGRGDCEDYAIAKYVLLRDTGIAEKDMRILLVRDRKVHEDHAVLSVRDGDSWKVLDNRYPALVVDGELSHFTPLFALDNGGVNLFASPYLSQRQNVNATPVLPASAISDEGSISSWSQDEPVVPGNTEQGISLAGSSSAAATLPILM